MKNSNEIELRNKLETYAPKDIYFLKEEWRNLIASGKQKEIRKLKGLDHYAVYDILTPSRVKTIRKAKYGNRRHSVIVIHSKYFEVEVIVKFDVPRKGKLGIVTYIKKKIKKL